MSRKLKLRIASAGDALDAFEVAWHRAAGKGEHAPESVLAFADLPLLLATLTPARWALLAQLREAGPLSINALARRLARDYKNVHTDATRLVELGLVERGADGRIAVPWDAVGAELRLPRR